MAVLHITYATSAFRRSAAELTRSMAAYGIASRTFAPRDPEIQELRRQYPQIMRTRRGAGYWLWKPFLIDRMLAALPDGALLLYTDAATIAVSDPGPLISLASTDNPIVLFEQGRAAGAPPPQPIGEWTSRRCLQLMNADTDEVRAAPMLVAGYVLCVAAPRSRAFVAEWLRYCTIPGVLADDPDGSAEPPGFRSHRHDQSVLSVLAHRHAIPFHQDPSQFGWRFPGEPFGQVFDLHRRRTRSLGARLRGALRKLQRRGQAAQSSR